MRRHMRVLGVIWVGSVLPLMAASLAPQTVHAASNYGRDLVGWWKFDEGGGVVAWDSSGTGNHALLKDEAAFTTDSLLGTAVDVFDKNGRIVVPYHPSLEPAVATIEVWLKIANAQDTDILLKVTTRLLRREVDGGFGVYGLRIHSDGHVSAYIANDDPAASTYLTVVSSLPELINLGEWHHLVMRWDGMTLDLFVDGEKHDSKAYDPVPELGLSYHDTSQFGLAIGSYWSSLPGTNHEFIGQLDEVRMYSRARSDREIWADYKSKGRKPAKPPGLIEKAVSNH